MPKSAAAARNRFLYVPDSQGIHRIPSSPLEAFSSLRAPNAHLGRILLSSVLREPFKKRNRNPRAEDESVDEFLTRRFGAEFARVFGSALVHGIYAADARKLSLRSAFPFLWDAEERGRGSVLLGSLRASTSLHSNGGKDYDLGDLRDKMREVSVYTFQDGIGMLVNALVSYLRKQPNVQMYGGVRIMGLGLNPRTNQFEVNIFLEAAVPSNSFLGDDVVARDPLPNACCFYSSAP